ncbi:hypothetical protein ALC62_12636, partial [Cyphomyrmex costatus]
YPFLGTPTELLIDPEVDWINYVSRGHLISPSSILLDVGKIMNIEFEDFHKTWIHKDPWIFKTVADRTEAKMINTQILREVLLCLVRTRTYIRVRNINKKIFTHNYKIKHNKKMSKFTNRKISKY